MGLEAEAIIQGKTLKRLASDIILTGISDKAMKFIREDVVPMREGASRPEDDGAHQSRRPRISSHPEIAEEIKRLWEAHPRPSQREIAKRVGYPASTVKYVIKKMLEKGELVE